MQFPPFLISKPTHGVHHEMKTEEVTIEKKEDVILSQDQILCFHEKITIPVRRKFPKNEGEECKECYP